MFKKLLKHRFVLASLVMILALAFPSKKATIYHGNVKTGLFHHSACEDYYGEYEKMIFKSQKDATEAKFKHCTQCFTIIGGKWVKKAAHGK